MEQEKKTMDSLMMENRTFPPPAAIKANSHISDEQEYRKMWDMSVNEPDSFDGGFFSRGHDSCHLITLKAHHVGPDFAASRPT